MSVHPEYLRGMKSAVDIIAEYIEQEKYIREDSLPDLRTIRDGLSMGICMAEMDVLE